MAKLEKDTKKVLDTQKISNDWVKSEGYQRFKKIIMEKIVVQTSLLRLNVLPNVTTEALVRDYGARQMLGTLLISTLQELEGEADSYESNTKLLNEVEQESLYQFFPDNG